MPARPPKKLRAVQGQMKTLHVTELKQLMNIFLMSHANNVSRGRDCYTSSRRLPKRWNTCLVAWFRDKRFLGLWSP